MHFYLNSTFGFKFNLIEILYFNKKTVCYLNSNPIQIQEIN